jgi:glycosyltransferase involved in cell wall biosynthesis/LmbE family N-acetylglucosaminyl deacetylase
MSKPRVSAVIICKNEEVMLPRVMDSIKGVDEIILCDTGSIDNTVEVAERYVGKGNVKFKQWNDSFCEARNYAKSFATGDWILSIDVDEVLMSVPKLRRAVELADEKGQLAIDVEMVAEDHTSQTFYFPRVFKNDPKVWWEGAIHNHLSVTGANVVDEKGKPLITITYGYSPAHHLDKDRAMRILKKEVERTGNAREMFYLAREYYYRGMWDEAIQMFGGYVQKSKFLAEKAEAFLLMARVYWELKRPDDARDALLQCIGINANFKEALLFMAQIAGDGYGNEKWQKNADQWRRMAETADNYDVMFKRDVVRKLFISPHDDDHALFGAFTCMRKKPVVCVVTDSFVQPNRGEVGCDAATRARETAEACKVLGVEVARLGIRDDALNEEILRYKFKGTNGFDVIYAPAIHEGGNPQHNMIGKIAKEVFGKKVVFYTTYSRTNLYEVGTEEVVPTIEELVLKEKALACYKSQINLPSTRPHFEAVRGKSEWLSV